MGPVAAMDPHRFVGPAAAKELGTAVKPFAPGELAGAIPLLRSCVADPSAAQHCADAASSAVVVHSLVGAHPPMHHA